MSLTIKDFAADPFADSFTHPIDECPYRMVVFSGFDHQHTPVYWVAGTTNSLLNARHALSKAIKEHKGACFYCGGNEDLDIDHALPASRGGSNELSNLLVSCKRCNKAKGSKIIDAFNPDAARRWLVAIMTQNRRRLDRINTNNPIV